MSRVPRAADDDAPLRSIVGAGVAGGLLAYLLSYVLTYAVASGPIRDSLASTVVEFLTGDPQVWKLAGWVLYNAHFVDVIVPGLLGGGNAVDFIAASDALSGVLYVVPPLVLLATGVGVVRAVGVTEAVAGLRAGAAVTMGYLPLVVGGALLFQIGAGDASAGPDLITAVGLAGVVYPAVFGGLGGALATAVGGR